MSELLDYSLWDEYVKEELDIQYEDISVSKIPLYRRSEIDKIPAHTFRDTKDVGLSLLSIRKGYTKQVKLEKRLECGSFPRADGHTLRRLKKGLIPVDTTLDLHNMNREKAYKAFESCFFQAIRNRYSLIRVITGKGKDGKGILKQSLVLWLNFSIFSQNIKGFSYAPLNAGGSGAYDILLINKKDVR